MTQELGKIYPVTEHPDVNAIPQMMDAVRDAAQEAIAAARLEAVTYVTRVEDLVRKIDII